MSDDFLSRWSRRKREARQAEEVDDAQPAPPSEPSAAVQVETPPAEEPGLTPEEIAELPKPEELTVESDLSAFLRKGVPDALRKAALRKMWTLDPEIRDFVGPARDYAYDWNVAGGVPGNGALLPTDDVPSMVRQIFGGEPSNPGATPGAGEEPSPHCEVGRLPSSAEAEPAGSIVKDEAVVAPTPIVASEETGCVQPVLGSQAPAGAAGSMRRHGGAKPH